MSSQKHLKFNRTPGGMSHVLRDKIALGLVKKLKGETTLRLLEKAGEGPFIPLVVNNEEEIHHLMDRAEAEERFVLSHNIAPLFINDGNYPSRLLSCSDSPSMLYQLGNTDLEANHVIAIVGSRRATPHGIQCVHRIVDDIAERLDDVVIISGLAYGIDVAAHKAAMDAGLRTVAVMAHGLNTVYPAEHRSNAVDMIKKGGSLITEYATCEPVHRINFLERNRIVAGLSDVVIVVESDERGGSLATARIAREYNREVFAVPGRISDRYSRGTNHLIANNTAYIFVSVDEMINELGWQKKESVEEQLTLPLVLSENEQAVTNFLLQSPNSNVYDIVQATGLPNGTVKEILFELEMKDKVMCLPGGRYSALSN